MKTDLISTSVLRHYPDVQALYLFGSYGSAEERPDSDVDLALLLLPEAAARIGGALSMSECRFDLEKSLGKTLDMVNLRRVSTVLQKEVTNSGRRIYTGDEYAAEEFEMLVLSFYQKLNEERREILEAFRRDGRAYEV